jgi:hypothetical protein
VGPPGRVRGIAPVGSRGEAADRLYQALYGCTMHPAGLLHSIAAILNAEADGKLTLADVARMVSDRASLAAALAPQADLWRYEAMGALCRRLSGS